jgi:hypothetical protein
MGSIPWSALVFLTLYFQLLGMSDAQASSLVAIFLAGVPHLCSAVVAAESLSCHAACGSVAVSVGVCAPRTTTALA